MTFIWVNFEMPPERSTSVRSRCGTKRTLPIIFLFYATKSLLGLRKMKEAMWRLDESGEFRFSDATDPNQIVLFSESPAFDRLKNQIVERFKASEATVGDVEEFVLAETGFRETHYKTKVLRLLELSDPPGIEAVNPPPGRRRGTYGDPSMRVRFL